MLALLGRVSMTENLQAEFVIDGGSALQDSRESLLTAWRWWCTAAGHPHIELAPDTSGLYRVRCDLTSAGKRCIPTDVPHFERILGEVTVVTLPESRFSLDDRVFLINGIEMVDSITNARNLVEYTTTGQFKQRAYESPPAKEVAHVHMKPMGPIERSDN